MIDRMYSNSYISITCLNTLCIDVSKSNPLQKHLQLKDQLH